MCVWFEETTTSLIIYQTVHQERGFHILSVFNSKTYDSWSTTKIDQYSIVWSSKCTVLYTVQFLKADSSPRWTVPPGPPQHYFAEHSGWACSALRVRPWDLGDVWFDTRDSPSLELGNRDSPRERPIERCTVQRRKGHALGLLPC